MRHFGLFFHDQGIINEKVRSVIKMKKEVAEKDILRYLDDAGEFMRGVKNGQQPTKRKKTRMRALLEQFHNEGLIDDETYELMNSDFNSADF